MLCVVQVGYGLFLCLAVSVLCSAGQRATVHRESFLSHFAHSGDVKIVEAGQRGTDYPLSSPDCPL